MKYGKALVYASVRIFNISLRALSILLKFLLLLIISRYLEPQEVGYFGLLTAAILTAVYPLGFNFYSYSTREIIKSKKERWYGILKNKHYLFCVTYLIFLPLYVFIFIFELLPWKYSLFFFLLLIIEHLGQESYRFLVAISRPTKAALILFIRSASWILILISILIYFPEKVSLKTILTLWVTLGLISLVITSPIVFKLRSLASENNSVDWSWIYKGIKIAIPFLIGSLAIRFIFTADRFYLEELSNLELVAAYTLYVGLAGSMLAFLDSSFFSFSYPKLIDSINSLNSDKFHGILKTLTLQVISFVAVYSFIMLMLIDYLLNIISRPIYSEHKYLLPWLLVIFSLNSLSMIPHYALYSLKKDAMIILSNILSLIVFLLCVYLFKSHGIYAVLYSLSAAMLTLSCSKVIFFIASKKNIYRMKLS